jgi:hypothetical protein
MGRDAQSQSKQMLEIVKRLEASGDFAITVFSDHTILHEPIEDWPLVQALISFYSDQAFTDGTEKQDEKKEEKPQEQEVSGAEKRKAGLTEQAAGAAEERKEVRLYPLHARLSPTHETLRLVSTSIAPTGERMCEGMSFSVSATKLRASARVVYTLHLHTLPSYLPEGWNRFD